MRRATDVITLCSLIPSLVVLFAVPRCRAADWPQYRADSARSGHTAEALAEALELRWTYRSPHEPRPAWTDPVERLRMPFDFAYQVAVAGGRLYFGSSADGKVYALDAKTGRELWAFFTDGPVRFAPAVWRDRVLAASDDGHLYCLAAGDGRLLWKRRGGPDGRKVLGNGRMVSLWPARGGPVIHDDIVYWGAGIFPSQGFFLYATDPESGETLAVNDTSGTLRKFHYTGGKAFSNVASQGYLAVAGDTLLVPTGRSIPAGYDRKDLTFRYFNCADVYRVGHAWVMAAGDIFFNDTMCFDVETGRVLCPRLESYQAYPWQFRRTTVKAAASPGQIFVSVVKDAKPRMILEVRALDRKAPFRKDPSVWRKIHKEHWLWTGYLRGRGYKLEDWMSPNYAWSIPVDCEGELIVAGDRIYVGGKDTVSAIDIEEQKTVWTAKVEGTAHGLAAAEGRLYVSTDRGIVYCFGAGGEGPPAVLRRQVVRQPYPENALYAEAAEQIVRLSGVTEGYCLDLGCGEGRLACELARRTDLRICAVDPDPQNVAAARKALDAAGLYGARVTVHQAELARTGYPNYFADLIVSARSVTEGERAVPTGEMRRLQRPYGGAACIGRPGEMKTSVRGPLKGAGNWTHQYADPANTGCSTDTAVRGPLGVLWFGDPGTTGMLPRHGHPPGPLFVEGRLYLEGDGFVRCVDGYNGRILWETRVEGIGKALYPPETRMGVVIFGSNICASRDSVYVHNRSTCTRLDGKTGRKTAEYRPPPAPDGRPGSWGYIACEGDTLFGTVESRPFKARWFEFKPRGGKEQSITEGVCLFAIDVKSGRLLWTHRPKGRIPRHAVAIGGGRAYLISRPTGRAASQAGGEMAALDAEGGQVIWRTREDVYGSMLALSVRHDVLLMAYAAHRRGQLLADLGLGLSAFRASDGKRLWDRKADYMSLPVIVDRTVIVDPGGGPRGRYRVSPAQVRPSAWDLVTGEAAMRKNPVTGDEEPWTFGISTKCSLLSASPNLLLFRTATTCYYDLLRDEGVSNYGGTRPNCCVGLIPAGGLVLCPSNYSGCTCSFLHMTSLALQPIEQQERWALFMGRSPEEGRIRHLALNLGSTGDRRDRDGVLWLALPRPEVGKEGGLRLQLGKTVRFRKGKGARLFRRNSDLVPVTGTDRPWVYASGYRGPLLLAINVGKMPAETRYKVRLHFAEPDDVKPGERVFDVSIGEAEWLSDFDVRKETGGRFRAVVKEFTVADEPDMLEIAVTPKNGEPVLCGLEVVALE